jgi:hypothetical protein
MAQEAKAGDVRAGVDPNLDHRLGRALIQGRHHADRAIDGLCGDPFELDSGRDDPKPEGFGEHQVVADLGAGVRNDLLRMDEAGDHQSVLRLGVVDAVAPDDGGAGLPDLIGAPLEDQAQDAEGQLRGGEADEVQGEDRPRPHGVDVAERVGGGHRPAGVGIVDDGSDEVHRLDDGQVVGELIHGGVIGRLRPDEESRIGERGQLTQHLSQVRRTDLAGSPRAVRQRRESNGFLRVRHP